MKVAIVGSGIAGLAAAHTLRGKARVTLFEADHHFGGHAHTVNLTLDGVTAGVDTGFLVFNHRTYPGLVALFRELGVETAASDMSFSVQTPQAGGRWLEWSGTNLDTVFSQRGNLLRPRFWRMLSDLMRFNAMATRAVTSGEEPSPEPLGDFLDRNRFCAEFREWYLLPMIACIWSCPTEQMLRFPATTLFRFCHNHGLLQVADRPQWHTVTGGSRGYVSRIVREIDDARLATPVRRIERDAAGVTVLTDAGPERFDQVVLATHPDQALQMLASPSAQEWELLRSIRYQRNRAVLHTDASVLPRNKRAWAAWNYEGTADTATNGRVCLHYLINRLQPLPWKQPVVVSLNPIREIARETIAGEFDYAHPVFDMAAIRAQEHLPLVQGQQRTWYAGAWARYGFHEDGLVAGRAAAQGLLAAAQAAPLIDPETQEALA